MEKNFRSEIRRHLSTDFNFQSEVSGTHFSGKRLYMDDIITPKNCDDWKNKNIAFGIEYKDISRITGDTTNFTKWLAQCVDYSNTIWDGYGYLYILTCPSLTENDFVQSVDTNWMLARVMTHLGVGELKNMPNYGWTIALQDSHRIWSELNGVESGRHWNLQRKFGSR